MLIKELNNFIPNNGFYASRPWYIAINNHIESIVKTLYGTQELFNYQDNANEFFKNQIDVMFMANDFNYQKIYEALTAKYNPLWNVESEETLEYDRTNTGTLTHDIKDTGTQTTAGSNTGTQTSADTTGSLVKESGTTFDSSTEYERGQIDTTNRGAITRTDNLADSHTRTDNLNSNDKRTDDLKEHYKETKIRGGNIGVTRSDELARNETDFRRNDNYNFMLIVASDISRFISYSV